MQLQPYRPDKFANTYTHHAGEKIWYWLNQDSAIAMMQTASYLRRPAIEALSPHLKRDFAAEISITAVRRMVGHMVRQILETQGYRLNRANVRITGKDNVFAFGSAYSAG
jgi:hypothetical protein